MAFRESVTVQFGADVGPFQRGLAQINSQVTQVKHELEHFGGRSLGHTLGIFGVIEGFKKIYEFAKEARTEAEKTGEAMSDSVRIVAQIGDGWDSIKHAIGGAGVAVVGFFGKIGSFIGQKMGTASSPQDIESLRRAEQAGKKLNANGLTPEQQKETDETEKKTAEAKIKAAEASRKLKLETMDAAEKEKFLEQELNDLTAENTNIVKGTLPYYLWQIKYNEKLIELGKTSNELDKEKKQNQQEINRLKDAEKNLEIAQKEAARHRRDAGLPTLSELAHSHGPGSGLAKMAERFESQAIHRSGSAPHESARLFERAQSLRGQLAGKIKSGDANPFADNKEHIDKLFKDVEEIKRSLARVKVGLIS